MFSKTDRRFYFLVQNICKGLYPFCQLDSAKSPQKQTQISNIESLVNLP